MKLGIVSDTHDNLPAIGAAMDRFVSAQVEAVLHAGDFVAPFALKRVLQARIPIYGVFGNNDGERAGLTQLLPDLAEGPRHLELGGKKICLVHDWSHVGRDHLESADIVVCGHTHEPRVEHREGVLLVNPGECGGWLSGRCTVAILDTDRMAADIEEVYQQARS
jgi:putative phosphoesterase